jgi:hypothetical protein
VRALGHILMAAGATVALVGLARWFYGIDQVLLAIGLALMALGFALPRMRR